MKTNRSLSSFENRLNLIASVESEYPSSLLLQCSGVDEFPGVDRVFDYRMRLKKREVALIIDNCTAHFVVPGLLSPTMRSGDDVPFKASILDAIVMLHTA